MSERQLIERLRVGSVDHVGRTVADIERSIAFYSALFVLTVHGPWERSGPRVGVVTGYPGASLRQAFLDFGFGAPRIELLEFTGGGPAVDPVNGSAGAAHFALAIDDVDAAYARLSEQGYRFVSPPITTARTPVFYGRVVYLIDPDGFRIELYQPLD